MNLVALQVFFPACHTYTFVISSICLSEISIFFLINFPASKRYQPDRFVCMYAVHAVDRRINYVTGSIAHNLRLYLLPSTPGIRSL